MADRLNMSLDEIIASRPKKQHEKKPKAVRSNQSGGAKFKRGASDRPGPKHDGAASRPTNSTPTKIVIVQRPKVVRNSEDAFADDQKPSVFARLAVPGVVVKFQNLRASVTEGDVRELCEAVGRVKHVTMEAAGRGFQSAAVSFVRDQDAQSCVAKYDGLALDGTPMRVQLDSKPAASAGSSTAAMEQIRFPTGENIRQGLFGTALADKNVTRTVVSRSIHVSETRNIHKPHPKAAKPAGSHAPTGRSSKPIVATDLDSDLDNYMAQR